MYSRLLRKCRHSLDMITSGKRVPCFEKVSARLATTLSEGLLPEPVGRDPEDEWEIYCDTESMLRKWPECTPTDFAWQFAQAEGRMPPEEHMEWFARAAAIIGIFAEHDHTIFLPERTPVHLPSRQAERNNATLQEGLSPARPPQQEYRRYARMLSDKKERQSIRDRQNFVDMTFPHLKEVSDSVMPKRAYSTDLSGQEDARTVRTVYKILQRHYQKTESIPTFREVTDEVGVRVGMPVFPLVFYTWAEIRHLHAMINSQMDAVYRNKSDFVLEKVN